MTIYWIPDKDGKKPEGTVLWAVPIDMIGITPKSSISYDSLGQVTLGLLAGVHGYESHKIPENIVRDFAGIDPMPERVTVVSSTPAPRRSRGLEQFFM